MKEEIRKLYTEKNIEFDEWDLEISEEILKQFFAKHFFKIARKKINEDNINN
ncbi:TPA: hypothetical protein ACN31Q_000461 [Vibrio campbellii]